MAPRLNWRALLALLFQHPNVFVLHDLRRMFELTAREHPAVLAQVSLASVHHSRDHLPEDRLSPGPAYHSMVDFSCMLSAPNVDPQECHRTFQEQYIPSTRGASSGHHCEPD